MDEIRKLLDEGLYVEFDKDDDGYIAHVWSARDEMHTGIADSPAGALAAAVEGMKEAA